MISSNRPQTDRWRPRWISQAAHLLLLLGAAGGILVAGRVHEGHFGVFFVLAGIALFACPPQARVDWRIVGFGAALLLTFSMALLPQSWFPVPEWRARLAGTVFPPAASVTPAPLETWFWLRVAAVAVCVGLFGMAHPPGTRGLSVIALAAMLICGLYGGLAMFAQQAGWEYPLTYNPAAFGFLPNRNHTAAFLVTGCVLALGILGVAARARQWLTVALAALCLATGVAGLVFFSASRGGIVFLFAGVLLWFAGLGRAHRSRPLWISFGAILVAGVGLFLASKSVVLDRMTHFAGTIRERASLSDSHGPDAAIPLDGRIAIFNDTLRLIASAPVTGTGLGTFRYTFRFFGKESLDFPPVIHPESDWVMLAAEAGIPALIALAVGLAWLLRRVWRLRNHPAWPLRWGILCAALAAFLHGFVDAPAHRTALGWWILSLFVLGLQTSPEVNARRSHFQHLLFIAGGLLALALGVQLIRAEWFGGRPSPPYAGFVAQPEIMRLRFDGKPREAVAAAHEAIRISPMTDALYLQLGAALLEGGENHADAAEALATQRLLNPIPPEIPVEQGFLWMEIDPSQTAALWSEAIERQTRIDAVRHGSPSSPALYRDLIGYAGANPDVQRRLLDAAARDAALTLVWLGAAAHPLAAPEFPRLAGDPAFLAKLDVPGRRRFLRAWYDRGERAALFEFIAVQPGWSAAAWPVEIRRLIDAGKFEEAVKSAAAHHKIGIELPPAGSGAASGAVDEANPATAFDAYWRRGNVLAARRILDEARRGKGGEDREVWRLSAALAVNDGQWQAAWQYLDRCLQYSGLDSIR